MGVMPTLLLLLLIVAPPDEGKTVARFKKAFRGQPTTADSVPGKTRALTAVLAYDSPRVTRALITAYATLEREAEPLVEKRRPLLEQGGGKKLVPFRHELRPIRELQAGIKAGLLSQRDPESVRTQVKRLTAGKGELPHSLKRTLAAAAGRLATQDIKLIIAGNRRGAEPKLALTLQALLELGAAAKEAGPWTLKMLQDKRPALRELAARTLGGMRWAPSLEVLVARLGEEQAPRVRTEIARALEQLTGVRLGSSPSAWKRWFGAEGAPFASGARPLGGHTSTVQGEASGGYYFGIPQDGRSIIYVYDASQSMKNKMGRKSNKKRVEVASAELVRALGQLKRSQRFNIVAFANRLWRLDREMLKATPANVKRAQDWVTALPLKLGTNTYDALELAFNTAGRGSYDRYYPLQADTVFLLSDGAPTVQKLKGAGLGPDDKDSIVRAVQRWNPFNRVVVHAIGIGLAGPRRKFMEQLAAENGGRFVAPR